MIDLTIGAVLADKDRRITEDTIRRAIGPKAYAETRKAERREFDIIWDEAEKAGRKAHAEALPDPMTVVNEDSRQRWFVSEGACGFGRVRFAGNTAFGRWAKKTGRAHAWTKGLSHSTNYNGSQSIDRADAAARAFAKVLNAYGIDAYGESVMD
jgi:hypothetical protein